MPKPIPELSGKDSADADVMRREEVPMTALMKIKVKSVPCNSFSQIWNSKQALSRKEASIWAPVHPSNYFSGRNKARVTLGHYAAATVKSSPGSDFAAKTIELTDLDVCIAVHVCS